MTTHNIAFDTNHDLIVERYRQGFRLTKPRANGDSRLSIGRLMNLPMSVYFYDRHSNFINVNDDCASLVAAESATEMAGKNPGAYCSREFTDLIFSIDDRVVCTESMNIVEEIGFRADDQLLQCMTVKLPWYYHDQVIGLLGFSIKTDTHSLSEFSDRMSKLIATGLMTNRPMPTNKIMLNDIHLSQRETEVLRHLVRGRTAKQIAERLYISRRTVEHHIEHLRAKSGCQSKSELIDMFFDHVIGE